MHTDSSERRQFSRFGFDGDCLLFQAENSWPCKLLDISLKGLLLETDEDWNGDTKAPFEVKITLSPEDEEVIITSTVVAHQEGRLIGMKIQYIDLDSITHLKRLVELNLGDGLLLERELAALIEAHQHATRTSP